MNILPPSGPARRKQLIGLTLAFIGVLAVGWYQFGRDSGTPTAGPAVASNPRAASPTAPTPQAAQTAPAPPALPEALELAALEPVPNEPSAGRNPFRFGVPPPPPRPPAPPPAPYVPPSAPLPPAPPPIPRIPLKFNGVMILTLPPDGEQRKVAILSDGQGRQFNAGEGQIVDGRYRLVKIGQESVLMEYLDGTGRMAIAIGGS